jgi:hypothetical protein
MDIRRKKRTLRAKKTARYPGFLSDTSDTAALLAVQLLCPYLSEKPHHQESLTPIKIKGGG